MPVGLKLQRRHKKLGYRIKYIYYLIARRDVLQKRVSFGNKHPEEIIYLIKPDYQDEVEGLVSLAFRQVLYINFALKKNYLPFIDWKNYKTQYYDGKHNAWEFFFKQPSLLTEFDVYESKNVYLSGWTFKNINPDGLFESEIFYDQELRAKSSELLKKCLHFNDEIEKIVEKEAYQLDVVNCIGVYIRGTDYVKLKPSGEYVQPTVEQVTKKIKQFIKKYNAPVFLVTEDGEIYDAISSVFGQCIRTVSYDTFIRNYTGKDVLSKSNVLDDDKKWRGQKYLIKLILLAKCRYLISSITQGAKFSYVLNNGRYQDEHIFDLGLYP